MLKTILLASALSVSSITLCHAATLPVDIGLSTVKVAFNANIHQVKSGNSGSGNSGGGNDDSGNDGGGDDGTPDQGGGNDDDSVGGNGGGNTPSGSGRKKPRIPGGSGCDDAGDIAEHAGCSL